MRFLFSVGPVNFGSFRSGHAEIIDPSDGTTHKEKWNKQ